MEKEIEKQLKSIGTTIRKIRVAKKIEIKSIASSLHLTPQAYGNIENGKTNISFSHLYMLTQLLQTDFNELLNTNNTNHIPQHVNTNNGNVVAINNGELKVDSITEMQHLKQEMELLKKDFSLLKRKIV
jgi:transcriptional regulator with XRE-family HTH domain